MNRLEELTVANIQQAFFEYRANFNEAITPFWYGAREGELINRMLKALSPWHLSLENISWSDEGKSLAEERLTFAVPSLFASVQVGIGGITTSAANPNWSQRNQFISFFQTAVDTLRGEVGQDVESQQTTLAFHVMPGEKPFREALSQFVNTKALGVENAKMLGVSSYSSDFSFVIDGSALLPDGVFIRVTRVFPAGLRFEEMAGTIYEDEERVLHLLRLKLQ